MPGGGRNYRAKGHPLLPLRLLAPILVAGTAGIFVTGVWLLVLGTGAGLALAVSLLGAIAGWLVWN